MYVCAYSCVCIYMCMYVYMYKISMSSHFPVITYIHADYDKANKKKIWPLKKNLVLSNDTSTCFAILLR